MVVASATHDFDVGVVVVTLTANGIVIVATIPCDVVVATVAIDVVVNNIFGVSVFAFDDDAPFSRSCL